MSIEFVEFNQQHIPPYRRPLLVQVRAESAPVFKHVAPNADAGHLLEAGVFYGYATVVLAFRTDGFGNRFPTEFQEIRIEKDKECVQLGRAIEFSRVACWAVLP
jgi:predicted O-methyltransferase YrrM